MSLHHHHYVFIRFKWAETDFKHAQRFEKLSDVATLLPRTILVPHRPPHMAVIADE